MKTIKHEREKKFNKLFDKKQKADEELKNYILGRIPVIGDKKLKKMLKEARKISDDFYTLLG